MKNIKVETFIKFDPSVDNWAGSWAYVFQNLF